MSLHEEGMPITDTRKANTIKINLQYIRKTKNISVMCIAGTPNDRNKRTHVKGTPIDGSGKVNCVRVH